MQVDVQQVLITRCIRKTIPSSEVIAIYEAYRNPEPGHNGEASSKGVNFIRCVIFELSSLHALSRLLKRKINNWSNDFIINQLNQNLPERKHREILQCHT